MNMRYDLSVIIRAYILYQTKLIDRETLAEMLEFDLSEHDKKMKERLGL